MTTNEIESSAAPADATVDADLQIVGKRNLHDFLGLSADATAERAREAADAILNRNNAEATNDPVSVASVRLAQYCLACFQRPDAARQAEQSAASEPVEPPLPGPTLSDVLDELAALRTEFWAKLRYDESKNRQIDQLHGQLQEYKQDLYFKMMRPLFTDLIGFQDSLYGLLQHASADATMNESEVQLRRSITALAEVIESTLDRYGVTAYVEAGEVVSGQRQRVERTVETDDPGRDRKIAERIRKGFLYDGRVVRPELIAAYRLKR